MTSTQISSTGTQSAGGEKHVSVHDLRKTYGSFAAVDGITFDIERGETFALLGPNGAGKSTTIEILEGYRDRSGGTASVLGVDPQHGGIDWKSRLGIVLQSTGESGNVSVQEQLSHFARLYPNPRDVDEVIAAVGLTEKAKTRIKSLSGGQRRRVDVALGVIGRPELLFLDEPTTGLDPQARRQLWELIDRFRATGRTTLLTTHYMDEAERLCDRVAIMDHGRVIALDTPRALIARICAEHLVEFSLEPGTADANALRALPGVSAVRAANGGWQLEVTELHRAVPALLAELERQRVTLSELRTHSATLEDVFVKLTGRHLRDD